MKRLMALAGLILVFVASGPCATRAYDRVAPAPRAAQPQAGFDQVFTTRTMRVDYFHTGGLGQEIFSLDRIVADGPWPGSRTRLVDETNLGKYRFKVFDDASATLLYSRGFASIYGEWETTAEVRQTHRTFHESLRFPW